MDTAMELRLRRTIFEWLHARSARGYVTREDLAGFRLGERRLPLIDRNRGIRNPVDLAGTLSIMTRRDGPYADTWIDGMLRYSYRDGDPNGGDNRKLHRAFELGLPIVVLDRIETNLYTPLCPSWIVADDPGSRSLLIVQAEQRPAADPRELPEPQRRYAQREVRARLHQAEFRGLVMHAYQERCAVCRLAHASLLDAAHITPDADPGGLPVVRNGLSMCKIHHAAYDQNMLGVTADYEVRINEDLLREIDGPMLRHGLQEMHGARLTLPARRRDHPDRDRLAARYARFTTAA